MTCLSHLRRGALALALLLPALAGAQSTLDLQKSSIVAGFKQMGVPLDGKFKQFALDMQFDPAQPAQTKVRIDVNMNSFDIGDESYNKEVRSKTWFNAAGFPKATFVSSAVRQTAPGRYLVDGQLSIKGVASQVSIPVQMSQNANVLTFDGTLPIKRLQFHIGEQEWKDTALVADEVTLKFRLVTTGK